MIARKHLPAIAIGLRGLGWPHPRWAWSPTERASQIQPRSSSSISLASRTSTLVDPIGVSEVLDAGQLRGIRPVAAVSYTHLRAHETRHDLVCRLLLEK